MARLLNLKFAACTSLFFVLACSATLLAQTSREATRVRGRQTSQRRPPPQMALASLERRPTLSLPPIVIYYSRDGAEVAASTKAPKIEKNPANIGESITIYYRTYKPSVTEPAKSAPKPNREQLANNIARSSPPRSVSANTIKSNAPVVDRPTNTVPAFEPTTNATTTAIPAETRPIPATEKPAVSETSDPKPPAAEPPTVAEVPAPKTVRDANPKADSKTEMEPKVDPVPAKISVPPPTSPDTEAIGATESANKTVAAPTSNSPTDTKSVTEAAPPPVPTSSVNTKPATDAAPPPVSGSSVDTKPAAETAAPSVLTSSSDTKPATDAAPPPPVSASSTDIKPAADTAPPPPGLSSSTDTVVLNNTAVQLTREHRYDEASDLLRRAIQIEPGTFKFHRNLSIVYEQMNKMDESLVSAETAVKLAPGEPTALVQLCGVQLQIKEHAKALSCYENLGKVTTLDSMSQTFYGVALLGSGRVLDALAVLEKAAAATPASAVTLNALGFVYFKERRFVEAISMFKKAIELEPDQDEMRFNLAIAQLAKGNKEGAISQYRLLKASNSKLAKQLYEILFRDHIVSVDELKH